MAKLTKHRTFTAWPPVAESTAHTLAKALQDPEDAATSSYKRPWGKRATRYPVEMLLAVLCLLVSAVNMAAIVWLVLKLREIPRCM